MSSRGMFHHDRLMVSKILPSAHCFEIIQVVLGVVAMWRMEKGDRRQRRKAKNIAEYVDKFSKERIAA